MAALARQIHVEGERVHRDVHRSLDGVLDRDEPQVELALGALELVVQLQRQAHLAGLEALAEGLDVLAQQVAGRHVGVVERVCEVNQHAAQAARWCGPAAAAATGHDGQGGEDLVALVELLADVQQGLALVAQL